MRSIESRTPGVGFATIPMVLRILHSKHISSGSSLGVHVDLPDASILLSETARSSAPVTSIPET